MFVLPAYSLAMCWLFLMLEPYGMRLRQVVMNDFYPRRARERAVWLFAKILRSRVTFVTFARREARRKWLKNDSRTSRTALLDVLRAKFNQLNNIVSLNIERRTNKFEFFSIFL